MVDFQPGCDSLNCMKLSLRLYRKGRSVFSERQSYFKEIKNYSLFALLLGASYMQKASEFQFSSIAEEIWFCLIFLLAFALMN